MKKSCSATLLCAATFVATPAIASFYEHTDAECRQFGALAEQVVNSRDRGLTFAAAMAMVDPREGRG